MNTCPHKDKLRFNRDQIVRECSLCDRIETQTEQEELNKYDIMELQFTNMDVSC